MFSNMYYAPDIMPDNIEENSIIIRRYVSIMGKRWCQEKTRVYELIY